MRDDVKHTRQRVDDFTNNQGTYVFPVYSGNGTSVRSQWGTLRLSYRPYSWHEHKDDNVRNAPSCYLSYDRNISLDDVPAIIRVSLYPLGEF